MNEEDKKKEYIDYMVTNANNLKKEDLKIFYRRFKKDLDKFGAAMEVKPIGTYIYFLKIKSVGVLHEMYVFMYNIINSR